MKKLSLQKKEGCLSRQIPALALAFLCWSALVPETLWSEGIGVDVAKVVAIEKDTNRLAAADALKGLKTIEGKWEMDGNSVSTAAAAAENARALVTSREWVDCMVKVKLKIDSCAADSNAGLRIILRSDGEAANSYAIQFNSTAQEISINEVHGMESKQLKMFGQLGSDQGKAIVPFALKNGTTYQVTVVAEHAALYCFINDQFVVRALVEDFFRHPAGKVGFGAQQATGSFSDLTVEPIKPIQSPFKFYEKNPLNTVGDRPTIIKDGGIYKMWSTGKGWTVDYDESKDGLVWERPFPHDEMVKNLNFPEQGKWGSGVEDIDVLKVDGRYMMFYPGVLENTKKRWSPGYRWEFKGMGLHFSTDGIHWAPYEHNPNFYMGADGSWDDECVGDHSWIKDGDRFKMWFTGINKYADGKGNLQLGYRNELGYAESRDGIHWKKFHQNPVVRMGAPGDWDGGWISCAAVLKLDDEVLASGVYRGKSGASYHLFYTGFAVNNENIDGDQRIGYAFSLDGIHWVKYQDPDVAIYPQYRHSTPIFSWNNYGQWGSLDYHSCSVMVEGDTVRMWVWSRGRDYKLGHVTAKVSDLLALVEKAKKAGLLKVSTRQEIDEQMDDAPATVLEP